MTYESHIYVPSIQLFSFLDLPPQVHDDPFIPHNAISLSSTYGNAEHLFILIFNGESTSDDMFLHEFQRSLTFSGEALQAIVVEPVSACTTIALLVCIRVVGAIAFSAPVDGSLMEHTWHIWRGMSTHPSS